MLVLHIRHTALPFVGFDDKLLLMTVDMDLSPFLLQVQNKAEGQAFISTPVKGIGRGDAKTTIGA